MGRQREQVVDAAEKYVKLAINNLAGRLPEPDAPDFAGRFDQRVDELFVHFLFPNLDEYERSLLVALRHFRRGITLGVHTRHEGATDETVADHERRLTESEASFVSLKEGLRALNLAEKLTTVQREVLEHEFLKVAFQPY